jgi:hypothetical protein
VSTSLQATVATVRRWRRAGVVILAALMVAGCSGGDDDKGGGAPPITEGPQTGKARAATLQPGDFPPGFEAQPDEPGQGLNIEQLWAELSHCLGVDGTSDRTGVGTSPPFLCGLATQARATVEYTSESAANAIAAAVTGPKFQSCATDAFNADVKRSAPGGGVPGPVAVAASAAPAVAPAPSKITSYRIRVDINLDELKVPLFQDFIVAVDRGTVIRLFFLNPGSEFPQDLERSLVEKVVSRA